MDCRVNQDTAKEWLVTFCEFVKGVEVKCLERSDRVSNSSISQFFFVKEKTYALRQLPEKDPVWRQLSIDDVVDVSLRCLPWYDQKEQMKLSFVLGAFHKHLMDEQLQNGDGRHGNAMLRIQLLMYVIFNIGQ